jgi:phospho-N-acetylmuramoyl-pentapeptide-transferase
MTFEQTIIILTLSTLSFLVSMAWTPLLSKYLYKYKCWRKKIKTIAVDGAPAILTARIEEKTDIRTPRMGGLLIWVTTAFLALVFFLLNRFVGVGGFDFVSRSQTWIPLFTLVSGSIIGFIDDWYAISEDSESISKGGGIRFRHRLALVSLVGLIGGSWLYFKLGWNSIHIPLNGELFLGALFIPLFILVVDTLFIGSVIDGIDGLSGGILSIIFGVFSVLSFARGQYELAAFCSVIFGSLLTFLWYNIPPARFYMGETGMIGLTTTLAVVAFFTDSVFLLPLTASVIVAEVATDFLQLASKRLRHGKKIWLAAPIHHHFQAKGWPSPKVTMRFWLISGVTAMIGLVIALIDLRLI